MGEDTRTELIIVPVDQQEEEVFIKPEVLKRLVDECDIVFTDPKSLSPEMLTMLRQKQAEWADNSLVALEGYLQFELVAVGAILYHGEQKKLYKPLGYDDLKQWMENVGGALGLQSVREYAKNLYLIKKPLELYDFGIETLISPKMSEVKAHDLLKKHYDWQRQESDAAKVWEKLPPEQQEAAKAQVKEDIRAAIQETLDLDDDAILAESARSKGSKSGTDDVLIHPHQAVGLDAHVQHNQLVCQLHVELDPSFFRYLANQLKGIRWQFMIRGEDGYYTPEQVAEWLKSKGYGVQVVEDLE